MIIIEIYEFSIYISLAYETRAGYQHYFSINIQHSPFLCSPRLHVWRDLKTLREISTCLVVSLGRLIKKGKKYVILKGLKHWHVFKWFQFDYFIIFWMEMWRFWSFVNEFWLSSCLAKIQDNIIWSIELITFKEYGVNTDVQQISFHLIITLYDLWTRK